MLPCFARQLTLPIPVNDSKVSRHHVIALSLSKLQSTCLAFLAELGVLVVDYVIMGLFLSLRKPSG